jgi:hypothetical protein
MYTSYIGKKFLQYYNEEYSKKYTAEEFFDEQMLPVFFNDERHLMHVGNSPFFQKVSTKDQNTFETKTEVQHSKLKSKINSNLVGGDIYVGYGSSDYSATTSGQLSDIEFEIDSEEMYLSWIGQAMSIGVKSGTCILIDNKNILLSLFTGWEQYSKLIEQTPNLKDKQIETWNGNYIYLILNSAHNSINTSEIDTAITLGKLAIQTLEWTKLIFLLSKVVKNQQVTVYSYSLSQTNQTFGFLNIYLKDFNELYEIRDEFFLDGKNTLLSDKQIEDLIPFYSFSSACLQGTLGLKSIEPRGLRNYLPKSTYKYSQGKEINIETEENYYLYKLWILAMLNKKELLHLSEELADILVKIQDNTDDADRGKTIKLKMITDVFDSKSIKSFIDKMTEINKQLPNSSTLLKNVVMNVVDMPRDNFPLFLTLIKFEYYNSINKKGN